MSLSRAIDRLSHDRAMTSVAREVMGLFARSPESWLSPDDVRARVSDASHLDIILDVFRETFVLDFEDAPPRYRMFDDTLLAIEVDRFLRRAERHDQRTQTNVARFRRRYHCS